MTDNSSDSTLALATVEREGLRPPRNRFVEAWSGLSRSKIAVASLVFIILVLLMGAFAPLLQTNDPFAGGKDALLPPLSGEHLLGTDHLGRDIWSQLVNGARVSLMVGFSVAAAATVIGIIVGALAGFYGGWIDSLLMRITEFFQTLPRLVLALIIVALFGSSVTMLIGVIAILSWPQTARVVRTGFMSLRSVAFVDAARVSGMPRTAIIFREILPNVLASVVVIASLDVGAAILTEASLSFFGLGDPNLVSWGGMLQQAQQYLAQAWWMAVFPGVAIALIVLAFNILGDGLNDALNPRLKERA